MLLTNAVHLREKRAHASRPEVEGEKAGSAEPGEPISGKSGFQLVLADRYLLLIGLLMLLVNLVNTTGEYILGKTVVDLFAAGKSGAGEVDEGKVIGEFYGNYFTIVNVLSAVLQAFIVSRVLKYFGVRIALLVLPVVALTGYAAMTFIPVLSFIRSVKLAENSLDYSLQNTTRNALYLPTSREAKYKAKQANDTFFVRAGDVLSAGLVFAGTTWLGFATKQFALVNAALVVVWLTIAVVLGKRFKQLAGTA
jgi:AAA family ATP:ADP antiporter